MRGVLSVSGGIMSKIIIITFAFLGFAFYEMSGGDEFVPIAEEKRAALKLEQAEEARMIAAAKAEALQAAPKPAPQIVLASAVVTQPEPVAAPAVKNDEVIAAVTAALEADKTEDVVAEVIEESPALDLREVTAARVNMRNGPGQNFNVVAKLSNGEQVEILQDPGDGWVKLRVAESGRVGWMADFLLTASNN